ncbi:MAG: hypothetical protein JW969_13525 [Spirochaetales bacterium]|nr:hypothetical protein [Spirochaetales bacterium]
MKILDSTLREGEQTPGVYFDNHIKMVIAELLDEIGIEFIEAGHPVVSNEICQGLKKICSRSLNATVCAHSRSLIEDIDLAIDCGVDFVGVFYCVSNGRIMDVYKKNIDMVKCQIRDVINYAKRKKPGLIIRFTPEDTVRSEFENVYGIAAEAVKAGADIISIADTTGYMMPGTCRSMYDYVVGLKKKLAEMDLFPRIEVHCHDDRGLALANALDAFRAGADIIDASVMGLGERAGIVDLAPLLVILKEDFKVTNNWNLKLLPELYETVSKYSKIPIQVNLPITGENVFSHCAGIHTQAAVINPLHYQSIDPGIVERKTKIILDHMAGYSTIKYALEQIGEKIPDDAIIYDILNTVKQIGRKHRTVDLEEFRHIVKWYNYHDCQAVKK